MAMPDEFVEHGTQAEILADLDLDAAAITQRLQQVLSEKS